MVGSILFRMLEKDTHGTCRVFSDSIAYCCLKGHFAIVHTSLFLHVGSVKTYGCQLLVLDTLETVKNTVVSTGKLQNAKPRLKESRDHE